MIHHLVSAKVGWTLIVAGLTLAAAGLAEHVDAFITTIPSLVSVVVGVILIIKQKGLHQLMNSRLSELLESVKKTSRAEGKEEQRMEDVRNKAKKP